MSGRPGVGQQRQTDIYLAGVQGRRPAIPFDPAKLERLARGRMSPQAFAYVAGGAGANAAGRDHWPSVFSAVFAGAGVVGGQVVGASDRSGAYPAALPCTPGDFAATIYRALGIDLDVEVRDRLGRPLRLVAGNPIEALYTAARS